MYKGDIVEQASVKDIFQKPQHPYTRGLLACRPVLHPKGKRLPVVSDFLNEQPRPNENLSNQQSSLTETHKEGSQRKLIEVKDLSVWFPSRKNFFGKALEYTRAVDEVSFEVFEGETLGLVGESGCGKTTLGRTLLRLVEPRSGSILYKGSNLLTQDSSSIKKLRKEIQIVFQDPYSSLNPRLHIADALSEPLKVHGIVKGKKQRRDKVVELLEKVSLGAEHLNRYPHEFSGGQRQRLVIARALTLNPSFVVCDESVSALDVSVQAQVLNLLNDLKKEFGFTIVFISHDLSVVRYISDRILVMNKGRIEEIGEAEQVYLHPSSEYTRRLIGSIPGIPRLAP
jgi:peptide/nickel transport system ATP-binding protein